MATSATVLSNHKTPKMDLDHSNRLDTTSKRPHHALIENTSPTQQNTSPKTPSFPHNKNAPPTLDAQIRRRPHTPEWNIFLARYIIRVAREVRSLSDDASSMVHSENNFNGSIDDRQSAATTTKKTQLAHHAILTTAPNSPRETKSSMF